MKIRKHIPNAITSMNLLSGCFAITSAVSGNYQAAMWFIIIAAIFDFCDGFAARLLKAYSPMGKELDSLADMVSFGVAPAMILFSYMQSIASGNIVFVPLLIAVFSGLRLAKFNIDPRQTEDFIGMNTPTCAVLCSSLIYVSGIYSHVGEFLAQYFYLIPVISVIFSLLLVSEIPMFSFKFKSLGWGENKDRFIFLGIVGVLALVTFLLDLHWSVWVLAVFTSYLLLNLGLALGRKKVIAV